MTTAGPLSDQLARWQQAGLLDAAQAEAIAQHERERATGRATATVDGPDRRTRAAEAVGYAGAALAVGALGLLLAQVWDQLLPGARVAVAAVTAVVAAGAALALRRDVRPALQRLSSLLAAVAVLAAGWTGGTAAGQLTVLPPRDVPVVAAAAACAVALPAYLLLRRALPQVALLVAIAVLLTSVVARGPLPVDPFWPALPVVALGAAWVLLGATRHLAPSTAAVPAGAALALLGWQVASFGDLRTVALGAGLVTALAAVGAAVLVVGATGPLLVGAVGLLVLLPQLVVEVFGDRIGAPATLLVVGLTLVLVAVGLGRARQELRAGGT